MSAALALLTCTNDVGTGSNRHIPAQITVEALGYFGATQIFNGFEAFAAQQFVQLGRIEKTQPGLTPRCRSLRNGYDAGAAFGGVILKRLRIVKDRDGLRHHGAKPYLRPNSFLGQVGYAAKPLEERRLVQLKSYPHQSLRKAFPL